MPLRTLAFSRDGMSATCSSCASTAPQVSPHPPRREQYAAHTHGTPDIESGLGAYAAAAPPAAPLLPRLQTTCVSSVQSREEWKEDQQFNDPSYEFVETPVRFRRLHRKDLDEVIELHRQLFPVQYSPAFFERLFTHGYFCQVGVSAETGEVITVASARVVDAHDATRQTDEAYIMTLGVKPSHRRCGLGARAMEQMLKLLRTRTRATYVALHVKTANRAACAFYDRFGFTTDPVDGLLEKHYYLGGEHWDACRYTRPLRSSFATMLLGFQDTCALL